MKSDDAGPRITCALYARCSKILNQDPENQLFHLRRAAEARGYLVIHEFIDQITSAKESRPGLNKLSQVIMRSEVKIVMIAALDRLARNTKHLLTIMESMRASNVALVSLREGVDFSTSTGALIAAVLGAVAQLERTLISERIRLALAQKKAVALQLDNGWRCGRPNVVTAERIEEAKRLKASGHSVRAIAEKMGIAKSSVQRILKGVP